MKRIVIAAALIATLGGCISIGPKAPKSLLTLTATETAAAGAARSTAAAEMLTIGTITVPAAIATTRIPVYAGATELAYVKDAAWNEAPSRLFARLLGETVSTRTGRIVIDARTTTIDPGTRLSGTLQRFGVDPARSEAVVTFDAFLLRGTAITTRRFEARVPVSAVEAREVGRALNRAANDVARQVAGWLR